MAKLMYRINNHMISSTKANDFQFISQCHDHGTRLRNNRNYCLQITEVYLSPLASKSKQKTKSRI